MTPEEQSRRKHLSSKRIDMHNAKDATMGPLRLPSWGCKHIDTVGKTIEDVRAEAVGILKERLIIR